MALRVTAFRGRHSIQTRPRPYPQGWLAAMTKAANSAVYYTNRATMNADGVSLKEIFETVASGGWIRSSAQLLMSLQVLGGEDVELDSLPGYVADASEGGIFINFRQFCTYAEYVGKLNGKQFLLNAELPGLSTVLCCRVLSSSMAMTG